MNCIHLSNQHPEIISFNNLEEYLHYLLVYLDKIEINFSTSQKQELFSFYSKDININTYNLSRFNDFDQLKALIDGLFDYISEDDYRDKIITCINASYQIDKDQKQIIDTCYQCLQELFVSAAA